MRDRKELKSTHKCLSGPLSEMFLKMNQNKPR